MRANGRASGPVLQSVFLAVIDHSEVVVIAYFSLLSDGIPAARASFAVLPGIHFRDGNVDGSLHVDGRAQFKRRSSDQFLQL